MEAGRAAMFKPQPLVMKKKDDPEALLRDWKQYMEQFKLLLTATKAAGVHTNPEVEGTPCAACVTSKVLLVLSRGLEVKTLFNHVGDVLDTDSWLQAQTKVEVGIKKQTNQAAAWFKLMQKMPQLEKCFAECFPQKKDQAERCDCTGFKDGSQGCNFLSNR